MAAPPSDLTGKPHPYQLELTPGSLRGAFEARKVRPGFYVRVDMPGVPNDVVKIVKYNETNTVTFSAKAPPRWVGFDTDTRVYAGYVVVDRDISDVDFFSQLRNGCLRMFFPRCDGSLHFLSPPSNPNSTTTSQVGPTVIDGQDEDERASDSEHVKAFISHDPNNPSGMSLSGGCSEHINPYLLSEVKGVYDHKIVSRGNGDYKIYVRLDVPDTTPEFTGIFENSRDSIIFKAVAIKKNYYSRHDEATREYQGLISPACQCCNFGLDRVVKFENSSGVLRFLVHKTGDISINPKPNHIFYCLIPTHGGALWHTAVTLTGQLPATSGTSRRRSSSNHPSQGPNFSSPFPNFL